MKQRITEFELDDESHWRAVLECGHRQHVRHDPPLRSREWVLTEDGRGERIGSELDCRKCDEVERTGDEDRSSAIPDAGC